MSEEQQSHCKSDTEVPLILTCLKNSRINPSRIIEKIADSRFQYSVTRRVHEQLNVTIHDVKVTFFEYPFTINPSISFADNARMPDLIELAAMKAYALGRRSKWKHYVDLYFLIQK